MQSIIDAITEVLDKKETQLFKDFLNQFDFHNVHWLLLSDYCIDDKNKNNDVMTFSLLVYHDKLENIRDFIKSVAPKDLKKINDVTAGFLSYINSPIVYHFSLIIPRKQRLLKNLLSRELMEAILDDFTERINNTIPLYPHVSEYYRDVLNRVNNIQIDIKKKSFNDDLFRRMFLAGSFGAAVIYFLKKHCNPKTVSWISDRDAIIQKFDGFAFDYMGFAYNMQPLDKLLSQQIFDLRFEDIPITGENIYDEMIRVPDFIAGTLASVDLDNKESFFELHHKHQSILAGAMTNSKNQANLRIEFNDSTLSAYSFKWVS